MVSGRGPFAHRRDANELVLAHMSEAPARLDSESEAPPEVADLVQRWLSKSPADRPVDAAHAVIELKHLLERYTFDGAGEGSTSAATASADYSAATHAEAAPGGSRASGRAAVDKVSDRKTSERSHLAAREAAPAPSEERPPSGRQRTLALGTSSRVSSGEAVSGDGPTERAATGAQSESPATQVLTGTMSAGDAPATRTVLPAPASKPPVSEGARPKAAPKSQRPTPRTGTPPPLERPRVLPELSLPRLLAVAAGAAALSFSVAALLRGPVRGTAPEVPQNPASRSTVAAARPEPVIPDGAALAIPPTRAASSAEASQSPAPSAAVQALPSADVPAEPSPGPLAATSGSSVTPQRTPEAVRALPTAATSKPVSAKTSAPTRPAPRPSSARMPDSGL
jgi:hypothetical protein